VSKVAYLPTKQRSLYSNVSDEDFGNHFWQDRNSVVRFQQLEALLKDVVAPEALEEMRVGIGKVNMSIRLNPYVLSLIDWHNVYTDPIRRQFLPMASEIEKDHPCLAVDSLREQHTSPVPGLVHRYPDKVLFLVTSVCPVYCQYCTRSYAVGQDTEAVRKVNVTSAQNWTAAFEYIRSHPQIEDVVVSGGDISRLKAANIRLLVNTLLDIPHIKRIRLATRAISVLPQKFLTDTEWFGAIIEVVKRGREVFKDVCVHTHFNHPNEVTPVVEAAMRKLHAEGIYVRNQAVLLRGVNDDSKTLVSLIKALGRVNIHPYYVYLCDMVTATEHFRVPLATAQRIEKEVRGATAGFNTPLFVCDAPGGGGKRDVHSAEFYNDGYGISGFRSPSVDPNRIYYYFDPIRALDADAQETWRLPGARDRILARLGYLTATAEAAE